MLRSGMVVHPDGHSRVDVYSFYVFEGSLWQGGR